MDKRHTAAASLIDEMTNGRARRPASRGQRRVTAVLASGLQHLSGNDGQPLCQRTASASLLQPPTSTTSWMFSNSYGTDRALEPLCAVDSARDSLRQT